MDTNQKHHQQKYPQAIAVYIIVVTAAFTGLKIGGQIDWSWSVVLSPLWLPLSFAALILAVGSLIGRVHFSGTIIETPNDDEEHHEH